MARLEMKLPETFQLRISKLADKTDDIVPKVLAAGGEVVLEKAKSNLESVIGSGTKTEARSTGQLARALGLSKARLKRDGSGWDIKVGFAPKRSDGKSNALIAGVLEYGKSGQPPKPFLKPAKSQSRKPAIDAMKAAFEREVDKV